MNDLRQQILEAVEAFTSNDLACTDSALIVIDPAGKTASLFDPSDDDDIDAIIENDADHDYVDVMDLVEADSANPGQWVADAEAIDELAAQY